MTMFMFYANNKNRIDKWLLIMGFILFLYLFVAYLFSYVAPFVIGFVISLILEPLVGFLQRRFKLNRGLLAFFSVAITSAVIIFAGTRLVLVIISEAVSLLETLPILIDDIRMTGTDFASRYQNMIELIPEEFQLTALSAVDGMVNSLASWATTIVSSGVRSSSSSIVKNFPGLIMRIFFCIISAFFFIKDKKMINDFLVDNCHPTIMKNFRIIKAGVQSALKGYFRAQLIIMTFAAIISLIGLTIMNIQYALLIGLAIMIFDGLPVFGSGTILIPWALYHFIMGNVSTGIGLLIIYGIITLIRQTLEPKILGEQIGIYPLATLMSIYIGLKVFGVLGFILGPVTIVTVKVLNEAWNLKYESKTEINY